MLQNDVTFCKMLHKQRKMSHLGFYFASLVDFLRQNFATLTDYRFFFWIFTNHCRYMIKCTTFVHLTTSDALEAADGLATYILKYHSGRLFFCNIIVCKMLQLFFLHFTSSYKFTENIANVAFLLHGILFCNNDKWFVTMISGSHKTRRSILRIFFASKFFIWNWLKMNFPIWPRKINLYLIIKKIRLLVGPSFVAPNVLNNYFLCHR
jgi:hypothetical protein